MGGIGTMCPIKTIVLVIVFKCVSSYPDGAPSRACLNLKPWHIIPRSGRYAETQAIPSPYTFTAKWDRHMRMVRVSVDGNGNKIQGFVIQGRLGINKPAIGSFINVKNPNEANVRYLDCSLAEFHENSTITHNNSKKRDNLEFYWKPPTNRSFTGNVTFYATIAEDKNTFWVMEKSNLVPLEMGDDETESSKDKVSIHVLFLSILVLYSCFRNTF